MATMHDITNRPAHASPAPPRRRIIVVDDSADMREVLLEVLGRAGYEVVGASSGQRALSLMRDGIPDVVITDLLMPEMSGFALRAAMLRRPELAGVPVVILSGYGRRPSETLEAAEVLPKPLSIDRLLATVARLIESRRAAEDGVTV